MTTINLSDTRFLRILQVKQHIGLSRSQIYKMIGEGKFPRQVRLSRRSVAWRWSEVKAW
ncbi:MAG TPA: AlpA family phage regulatory protein, partial [Rhodanobacter sp.]|nr:AlpA family phage regulatory protein [Rhodanobacter sp.]